MKNWVWAAVGAGLIAIGGIVESAAARDLVYGSWLSANNPTNTVTMSAYFDAVDAATNGEVNVKILAGGQVVSGEETLDAVKTGLVDAGLVIAPYTPAQLPATDLIFKTLVADASDIAVSGALMETILLNCPQCIDEYKKNNGVVFAGYSVQPYYLMCTKPIETVDDVKGLKVRATGTSIDVVRAAGATPVGMNIADSVMAMERGVIDCTMASFAWLLNFGYIDVVDYVLDYPLGAAGPSIPFFLNRDAWNDLSEENRKVMLENAASIIATETLDAQRGAINRATDAVKERGLNLVKGGEDFGQVLKSFIEEQREVDVKDARDKGVENPEAILDAYDKALVKWRGLADEIGDNKNVFIRVLNREIYQKLTPEQL